MGVPQTDVAKPFPVHKLVLGVLLLALGALSFIDALDLWHPRTFWRLWPLGLIIVGLALETDALLARQDSSGSLLAGFGLWMLAGTHQLFGLTYRTGLPLGIAVVGLFMVLHALMDRPNPQKEVNDESR